MRVIRRLTRVGREHPWRCIVIACVALALLSMVSNIVTMTELDGGLVAWSCVRKTFSKLLNSGVVWAGLPVYAGWLMRRPWMAALVGLAVAEAALALHYASGQLVGLYDAGIWPENRSWFIFALVTCPVLGLVGYPARGRGWVALLARLVVPVGAVLEALDYVWFFPPPIEPVGDRVGTLVCALVLAFAGGWGCWTVVATWKRQNPETLT